MSVNINEAEDLICSQDDAPGTLKSSQEIEQFMEIARSSVGCILRKIWHSSHTKGLWVKKMNTDCRVKHLQCCLQRFLSERSLHRVWFTDEK